MSTISKEDIIGRRLDNQQVGAAGFVRPESLVAWMGCIQAQDFAGAKWAIGSRLKGQAGNDVPGGIERWTEGTGPANLEGRPDSNKRKGNSQRGVSDKQQTAGAGQKGLMAEERPGAKRGLADKDPKPAWTDAGIQQAFDEGKILRTHILRPTWHLVTPADIHWILALTAPRIKTFCTGMHRQLELDQAVFRRSHTTLRAALAGGRQLTRKELLPVFQRARIRTDELRLAHLLMQAELDGIICSGAMSGKQFTYALMEDRAPGGKSLPPEEATAELALRYFKSRGPATLADFAWWSGLTVTDGRKGIEAHQSQFINEVVNGQSYWIHCGSLVSGFPAPLMSSAGPSVKGPALAALHILPAFDEYTIAYKDRGLVLSPKQALRSGNGIFKPVILHEGQIAGTWQRTVHKDHIGITTDLFRPLGQRALKKAFARYGAFMEKPIVCHFE